MTTLADQFVSVCSRYGVKIVEMDEVPDALRGPRLAGCSVSMNQVFVPRGWRDPVDAHDRQFCIDEEPETYIHELSHIICQPPNGTISDVPEDWLLIQFERQLARYAMPTTIQRVIMWQHETEAPLVCAPACVLSEFGNYRRDPAWQRGFCLAQKVGLLDSHRRPTWRRADWSKLTRRELRSWHL